MDTHLKQFFNRQSQHTYYKINIFSICPTVHCMIIVTTRDWTSTVYSYTYKIKKNIVLCVIKSFEAIKVA